MNQNKSISNPEMYLSLLFILSNSWIIYYDGPGLLLWPIQFKLSYQKYHRLYIWSKSDQVKLGGLDVYPTLKPIQV